MFGPGPQVFGPRGHLNIDVSGGCTPRFAISAWSMLLSSQRAQLMATFGAEAAEAIAVLHRPEGVP
jgi:hypothetical protein